MSRFYPMTALIGSGIVGAFLGIQQLRKMLRNILSDRHIAPAQAVEYEDYGTPVAPTW